jgi:hypothetical protein
MPVGPDATAMTKEASDFDNVVVGGVLNLGNPERPEIDNLHQGTTEAIQGRCY